MVQNSFAAQPSIDAEGNRKFDHHHLTGRYILNLSGCDIDVTQEPGNDVILYLFKNSKKPAEKFTLGHNESRWVEHFYLVFTSVDGRNVVLPQAFNEAGLLNLKAAVKSGRVKS